jgi:hypothetical protein
MASKDEAFGHFRSLALRLSVELLGALKAIRSDNGIEFKNSSFEYFCAEKGIEHQFSSPRVPQQNCVVERKNRTLIEMAWTVLDEFSTPRKFWADAISTACYVSNCVFLRSKLGKTPYELCFEHRPSVSHLRVFGCKYFVLKPRNLDKFEARSTDGIFLGYPAHSRGYRVLVLEINKIIETCDETSSGSSPSISGTSATIQEESIFVDEDKNLILVQQQVVAPSVPTTTSPMIDHSQASTLCIHEENQGESGVPEIIAPLHIQRRHPPQQMIDILHERVTRSKSNDSNSVAHSTFIATFEPKDISHALTDKSWINAMHEELENFEQSKV